VKTGGKGVNRKRSFALRFHKIVVCFKLASSISNAQMKRFH